MWQSESSTKCVGKKKICLNCSQEYTGHPNGKFCSDACFIENRNKKANKRALDKSRLKYPDGSDLKTYVECIICGFRSADLNKHPQLHGITSKEYTEKYGKLKSENTCNSVRGINNPAYNHDGRLSPYSKKFIKYENEKNVDAIISNLAKRSQATAIKNNNHPKKIEYYLTRGFTEEDGRKIIAEKSSFTLEKCIKKYGEIDGLEFWKNRQLKWQETLNSKSDIEKQEINRKKLYKNGMTSKIESKLYNIFVN